MKNLFAKRWVRIYALIVTVGLLIALVIVPVIRGWGLPDDTGKPLSDSAGLLTQENHLAVNAKAESLTRQFNTEVRIAVVESLQGADMAEYARRLHDHWAVGRREINGGLLVVVSAQDAAAYIFPSGNFGKFMTHGMAYEVTEDNVHSAVMRTLETAEKQLQAFRATDLARVPNTEMSVWEKLAPLWVVLGIAVIMAPIVFQERIYFFGRKENRGGIFRPMYNVGGGNLGQPNYHARGKN